MKPALSPRRGGPLVSLAIVLGGWAMMRVAVWEAPFANPVSARGDEHAMAFEGSPPVVSGASDSEPVSFAAQDARRHEIFFGPRPVAAIGPAVPTPERELASSAQPAFSQSGPDPAAPRPQPATRPVAPGILQSPPVVTRTEGKRWSLDAWALWREDTTTPLTSGRPSYGRSQAGAVLRYRLAPGSGHAPQAHLRAVRALDGESETDIAAGLSARPLPAIPVRLAAEARVSETDRGTELRGAAYAVTELAPIDLPAGLSGEAYLQGGYVTGEYATAFVDGQARVTKGLAGSSTFKLTAGGGAWGGAQEDGRRLDIGPTAALEFGIGGARGRISADYRFRVAGNAEPSSGPALTLTAGF
ncbi:hypothetical protein [Aurantiacibacter poecillastricola]|uniref:hypothetical protein n=1 Tax=Aurantiacibacter poecillastricola TaxID=3064385 RepID=UPI00273E38D1|nr:hypothetical protein [Aurantiacibacter sp. 219JJ12-13]MDP5262785.1 hypothetical protein [Aurantiacibacter sp. 219JJ12-13]